MEAQNLRLTFEIPVKDAAQLLPFELRVGTSVALDDLPAGTVRSIRRVGFGKRRRLRVECAQS
jgi:hypothetical protein